MLQKCSSYFGCMINDIDFSLMRAEKKWHVFDKDWWSYDDSSNFNFDTSPSAGVARFRLTLLNEHSYNNECHLRSMQAQITIKKFPLFYTYIFSEIKFFALSLTTSRAVFTPVFVHFLYKSCKMFHWKYNFPMIFPLCYPGFKKLSTALSSHTTSISTNWKLLHSEVLKSLIQKLH